MNVKLGIKNYRSIGQEGLEIEFKPLNFIAGDNGSGKSILLHPLVLLYQSYRSVFLPKDRLMLNGKLLVAPNPADDFNWIRNRWTKSNSIEFDLVVDDRDYHWEFEAQRGMGMLPLLSPPVDRFPIDCLHYFNGKHSNNPFDCVDLVRNAPKHSILVLEHPDLCLDGGNLRILAERIAEAAARGVVVIVESHGLHLFNGVRIAVIKNRVNCEDVAFWHCQSIDRQLRVQPLKIDRYGRLPMWPKGFFDQLDLDIDEILAAGKKCG
jgi:predicted ATPase